jgi:hypothetical protein
MGAIPPTTSRSEEETLPPVHGQSDRAIIPVTLLSAAYFVAALVAASLRHYTADEVFVLWLTRNVPLSRLYEALRAGTDSLPPGYYLLSKAMAHLAGANPLALRLPSILGFYAFLAAIYSLARKYSAASIAAFSAAVVCVTEAGDWAVMARPYAIMLACFGVAVVLWERCAADRHPTWRQAFIAVPLAAAVGVHFYSVLFAPAIGIMEALWMARNRRFRWVIWSALLAGAASVLMWWPVIKAIYDNTHGSAVAAGYYASPTPSALVLKYIELCDQPGLLFVLLAFCLASAAATLFAAPERAAPAPVAPGNTAMIALGALLLPAVTFVFSLLLGSAFNARYFIAATLGLGLSAGMVMTRLPHGRRLSAWLAAACILAFALSSLMSFEDRRLSVLGRAPEPLPVLTPFASDFFELSESAPPDIRRHLVYAGMPHRLQNSDLEPQRIAAAWKQIRPELQVFQPEEFLRKTPEFYVLCTGTPRESLTVWLS